MIKLSVIIATYNRWASLQRTLSSFRSQELDRGLWEIVVVDNNSDDDTSAAAAGFATANKELNIKVVAEPRQGLSYARNRGIAESRSEYIVMVDDDVEVNDGFTAAYYQFFQSHPDVAATGGKIAPLYEYQPPRWLTKYTERPIAGTTDLGDKIRPMRKTPIGCNMAFRRTAVESYGGFDTALGRKGNAALAGEEKEFFGRMLAGGEKIYYVPGALVHHIIPKSRFTDAYFDKVTCGSGASERIRTLNISRWAYIKRLGSEAVKWGGTWVLAAYYNLLGSRSKSRYLIRMRHNISCGLLARGCEDR